MAVQPVSDPQNFVDRIKGPDVDQLWHLDIPQGVKDLYMSGYSLITHAITDLVPWWVFVVTFALALAAGWKLFNSWRDPFKDWSPYEKTLRDMDSDYHGRM